MKNRVIRATPAAVNGHYFVGFVHLAIILHKPCKAVLEFPAGWVLGKQFKRHNSGIRIAVDRYSGHMGTMPVEVGDVCRRPVSGYVCGIYNAGF